MKIIKNYLFTSIALAIITFIMVPSSVTENNTVINQAMTQAGWCRNGDSVCLVRNYFIISLSLIILGIIFDTGVQVFKKRRSSADPKKEILGDPDLTKKKFDIKKLRLAEGGLVDYPKHDLYDVTIEEYSLTLINETGQDLKRCFVLLDEVATNQDSNHEWQVESADAYDKPFRWKRDTIYLDGKVDIENDERASFIFFKESQLPVLNMAQNQNEPIFDYRFTFFNDETRSLINGTYYRLLLSVRGRYQNGESFAPVKYHVYIQLNIPIPGVKITGIARVN